VYNSALTTCRYDMTLFVNLCLMDLYVTVYWLACFNVWYLGDMSGLVDLYPYSVGITKVEVLYIY